jgi:HAMP N-terminal domain 3
MLAHLFHHHDREANVQLHGAVAELARVLAAAASGDTSPRVTMSHIKGIDPLIGQHVNKLLDQFGAIDREVQGVAVEHDRGDIKQLPGKKVFISETVERVRTLFKQIDLQRLEAKPCSASLGRSGRQCDDRRR